MAERFVVTNEKTRNQIIQRILTMDFSRPVEFQFKQWRPKRSLSANALYWKWLSIMERHFNGRYSKAFLHDAMKHLFLGYKDKHNCKLDIPRQLKDSRTLNKAEFCEYMTKVDAWAVDHGLQLPRPEDCDYDRYLRGRV